MSIIRSDYDHTLPLTPASFFTPLDTVAIDTTIPTGQLVVTGQVPTHVMINTSVNATNPFLRITRTNQGVGGYPTHHEWAWF